MSLFCRHFQISSGFLISRRVVTPECRHATSWFGASSTSADKPARAAGWLFKNAADVHGGAVLSSGWHGLRCRRSAGRSWTQPVIDAPRPPKLWKTNLWERFLISQSGNDALLYDVWWRREAGGRREKNPTELLYGLITNRRDFSVSLWSNENITQNTITEVLNFH